MKRIFIFVFVLALFSAGPAFAQDAATGPDSIDKSGSIRQQSDYYPYRVDVVRVYSHGLGYRVVYRKGNADFAEAFIPAEWFVSGGKAMLVRMRGLQIPYMVVYYKDKKFSHVKLFAHESLSDPSWGQLDGDPAQIAQKFKVEDLKIEF